MLTRLIFFICAVLLLPALVEACFGPAQVYSPNPAMVGVDVEPPSKPRIDLERISRGHGPIRRGDRLHVTCLDGYGAIAVLVECVDDSTSNNEIGYRFVFLDGTLPDNFLFPGVPVVADFPLKGEDVDRISLRWGDGAADRQEPFEFRISIVAIDGAGNESAPSEPILVYDEGKPELIDVELMTWGD